MKIKCKCGATLASGGLMPGKKGRCPICHVKFTIPPVPATGVVPKPVPEVAPEAKVERAKRPRREKKKALHPARRVLQVTSIMVVLGLVCIVVGSNSGFVEFFSVDSESAAEMTKIWTGLRVLGVILLVLAPLVLAVKTLEVVSRLQSDLAATKRELEKLKKPAKKR